MDLSLTISNRQIVPAVVNVYQYENDTNVMKFTLDSYMHGEVDLRNYAPYVITSQNGLIDYTEAEMNYDEVDDVVTLTWNIQEYSLREQGAVLYQICFKETTAEGEIVEGENTAVFYSYKAIVINRGSVDGDHHLTANYPTLLKQWLDKMNAMKGELDTLKNEAIEEMEAVRKETVANINGLVDDFTSSIIYIPYGETMPDRIEGHLYYQYTDAENTKGQFEDHEGNVLIDGMACKAINVLESIEEDTIDKWCELGAGVYYFSELGLVSEQPSQYGFLINFTTEYNDVFQIWKKQSGGKMYYRSANANNWGESWVEMATTADVDTKLNKTGGTLTGELNMSSNSLKGVRNVELVPSSTDNHGGFLDFHFNGSSDDYTSRIIEGSEGRINVLAPNGFKVNDKNAILSVNGEVADQDGNVEVVAYDDVSFTGTTLTLSRTNDTSSAVDLGNTFATDSEVVKLTGDQTVAGVKTFSSSPKVPTVAATTNDTTAASCQWVTSKVTNYQPAITALSATSGTVSLAVNKIYTISVSGTTTFSLPTPSNTNVFNQIKVMMKVTGTPTINWGTTRFFNKKTPEIEAGNYDVYFDYDKLLGAWVCGTIAKGVAS